MHSATKLLRGLIALAPIAGVVLGDPVWAAEEPAHEHSHVTAPAASLVEPSMPMMTMQKMRAMHESFMAAKTPAERQALMADHMKLMQEGMTEMQNMGAPRGQHGNSADAMRQRMDMMTMMMQMMMDHQIAGDMPKGMGGMGTMPNK